MEKKDWDLSIIFAHSLGKTCRESQLKTQGPFSCFILAWLSMRCAPLRWGIEWWHCQLQLAGAHEFHKPKGNFGVSSCREWQALESHHRPQAMSHVPSLLPLSWHQYGVLVNRHSEFTQAVGHKQGPSSCYDIQFSPQSLNWTKSPLLLLGVEAPWTSWTLLPGDRFSVPPSLMCPVWHFFLPTAWCH